MGDRGECFVTVVFIKEWEALVREKVGPEKCWLVWGSNPGPSV